ncbi:hypothetical protein EST38_g13464 [Candolleomyces aberdarensis]|uniref:Superkiller protein 3 n=1 Tax=Candolleomyces aberdarensis TaxID=2316362 RepID=A0A4Q2D0X6_9AGAR|nr:hypothetical protein EST38_g13464 [Candolleomyces aberdarensis]
MSTKALLKTSREKLNKKDFSGAKDAAERVLDFEPSNYTAHVFLALSLLELEDYDRSEQVYKAAIELDPGQLLARQIASALMEVLPGSEYYPLLSSLPEPDSTNPTSTSTFWLQSAIHDSLPVLEEVVSLLETEEQARFTKDFNARRTRLGGPKPAELKKELDREICDNSKLPTLYNEVLNHPKTSEDLRRSTEAKLIQFKQKHLYSTPATGVKVKGKLREELENLIDGVVLIRRPNEEAWLLYLDWQDWEKFEDLDLSTLRAYVELFPDSSLASIVKGYLFYNGVSLSDEGKSSETSENLNEMGLDVLLNIPSESLDSILANRVIGQVYADVEEYENAAKIAKRGLSRLAELEKDLGKQLSRSRVGLQVVLATSLVHLHPPKNHAQAMTLIKEIVAVSPDNLVALMSRGNILLASRDWSAAKESFDRVVSVDVHALHALRAREESAWCESRLGQYDSAIGHFEEVLRELEAEERDGFDVARCLWRLAQTHWDSGGKEAAYALLIRALKKDSSYAPAFTSLGLYYLECASPPDPVRASKCFQKAFELDPREAVAARHLAEGFANDRDWDLVEVVVRRTIEGEGTVQPSSKPGAESASGDVTVNSWAWKALGVVELNYRNYPAAINAFQVALRADPNDHILWLRLGEAYGKAGRYAAAIKALEHAHELDPTDWLAQFYIADAQQGVGLFKEAVKILESLLEQRPAELGILSSLATAYLDMGVAEMEQGFIGRAESSFISSVSTTLKFLADHPGFRTVGWKIITDATFHLSQVSLFRNEEAVLAVLTEVNALLPPENARLKDIIPSLALESPIGGSEALLISILAAEYRVSLSPTNSDTSAWYDLGMGVRAWSIQSGNQDEKVVQFIIACITEAVKREPMNASYWTALGTAYFVSNPRAAQHSFIKALEIENKRASTWCDLGLLYLFHEDTELAQEAFQRAQVLDPDCTLAWVGQALISRSAGDEKGATALFSHATGLDHAIPEADYNLGLRVFNSINERKLRRSKAIEHLLPVFFLLNRYCERKPDDATGLHLFALACERLGHIDFAKELVNRAMRILERIYEEKEDPVVERQFMIANATLGRLLLSTHEPEEGMIIFETVLGLLQDTDELKQVVETQAKLGIAMAQCTLRDMQEAILSLQYAQGVAPDHGALSGQCAILLAQTLWSIRDPECCEMAKEELLKLIAQDPSNLPAINVLAGLGILTKDEGLVDASVSEIVSLPPDERVALDSDGNVDYLLIQYHLSQNNLANAIKTSQKSVHVQPSNTVKTNTLGSLLLKMRYPEGTLALLSGHEKAMETGSTTLILSAVANALIGTPESLKKALQAAQRAVMVSPGKAVSWQVLACVRKLVS